MLALSCFCAGAQELDERLDTLESAVFITRQTGNYLAKSKDIRTEVISSAGLQKMACCSLADSFENSASVNVGFSDAVTGARQIRLLGLSGTYIQTLDEARPVMRGLSAPFGLSYIPSPWLESIQIAKGASSVVGGNEAMTGSINMEHKKPTDETPLFINASYMNDTKTDLNAVSSLQFGDRWSTVLFGHVSGNLMAMDDNGDGFADEPKQLQFNVGNRWLYFTPDVQVRFGVRAIKDSRNGGQIDGHGKPLHPGAWVSDIDNSIFNAYLKIGRSLGETASVAMVADYNYQKMDSSFGPITRYDAAQNSGYFNLLYQNAFSDAHSLTAGIGGTVDRYDENLWRGFGKPTDLGISYLRQTGVFGEYTYHHGEVFTAIAGLRADHYSDYGTKITPRINLRYAPSESFVFRANAGRGLRHANPITDNIGILSTSKTIQSYFDRILESAWIAGGNATWYFGGSSSNYFGVDYFHTRFGQQQIVDYDSATTISIYKLSDFMGAGRSFTNTYQADLALEPFERFTVNATFRYTDARVTLAGRGLVEKPMTSRYKGVLNLQYALPLNKWIFDFTASLNGPCRLYDFMDEEYSPVYPALYAQITKRMKGFDIYFGGENITGFRQKDVIISAENPLDPAFDASVVWGPVMGAKIYAGIRITIWKQYND